MRTKVLSRGRRKILPLCLDRRSVSARNSRKRKSAEGRPRQADTVLRIRGLYAYRTTLAQPHAPCLGRSPHIIELTIGVSDASDQL